MFYIYIRRHSRTLLHVTTAAADVRCVRHSGKIFLNNIFTGVI